MNNNNLTIPTEASTIYRGYPAIDNLFKDSKPLAVPVKNEIPPSITPQPLPAPQWHIPLNDGRVKHYKLSKFLHSIDQSLAERHYTIEKTLWMINLFIIPLIVYPIVSVILHLIIRGENAEFKEKSGVLELETFAKTYYELSPKTKKTKGDSAFKSTTVSSEQLNLLESIAKKLTAYAQWDIPSDLQAMIRLKGQLLESFIKEAKEGKADINIDQNINN